ncbi:glutathione-disulfide reductase [Prochlorococcus marinus]|uniref:glutathione-disulfide reductase n=1 Tax=Prochlorococcus marinus TaxID=1219 RepID=UPI0022B593A8|nr:glutathione-disulfide reductase [Prochlorococcus marinus]
MDQTFDLIVLGAGSGGLAAAKRAASYGARVAIVEGDRVGGTCVIKGCVPKKLMVYGSQYLESLKSASKYGAQINNIRVNKSLLLESIREEVDRLNKLHIEFLAKSNVELIRGWGSFSSPKSIVVKNMKNESIELFAKNILIAVGGIPCRPNIPGASLGWVSDDVFLQSSFPKELVIIGGGYIACEFACILNGLGVQIKQLIRGNHLLRGFDKEVSLSLQDEMLSKGIDIRFGTEIISIDGSQGDLNLIDNKEGTHKCGAILFATGREPSLNLLNLNQIGVELEGKSIKVDNKNLTSISNIYAIGDVSNKNNLTPVAIEEGRVFADNLFGNKSRSVNYNYIPKAVFSQPEFATVGITEEYANNFYGKKNIKIYKAKFRSMSKVLSKSKEKCFLKLIVEINTDKILGCHMLGENASEIIQMASIAISMGALKSDFDKTMALHPTIAEEFVTMT